jgi:hypothetical protein
MIQKLFWPYGRSLPPWLQHVRVVPDEAFLIVLPKIVLPLSFCLIIVKSEILHEFRRQLRQGRAWNQKRGKIEQIREDFVAFDG